MPVDFQVQQQEFAALTGGRLRPLWRRKDNCLRPSPSPSVWTWGQSSSQEQH